MLDHEEPVTTTTTITAVSLEIESHTLRPHQTPQPTHFLKAYDTNSSKMEKDHKYKDTDNYKDNDKNKDAEKIKETQTMCYILGILMTQALQV